MANVNLVFDFHSVKKGNFEIYLYFSYKFTNLILFLSCNEPQGKLTVSFSVCLSSISLGFLFTANRLQARLLPRLVATPCHAPWVNHHGPLQVRTLFPQHLCLSYTHSLSRFSNQTIFTDWPIIGTLALWTDGRLFINISMTVARYLNSLQLAISVYRYRQDNQDLIACGYCLTPPPPTKCSLCSTVLFV